MYTPRLRLESTVLRIPIAPGSCPRTCYGDLSARGVRGIVLEAFGVGNMPDGDQHEWLPWLREQREAGLEGIQAGPLMSPECAVVKMMLVLAHQDLRMGVPLAGEMTF